MRIHEGQGGIEYVSVGRRYLSDVNKVKTKLEVSNWLMVKTPGRGDA